MDELFKDVLAMRLAQEWADTITNSNTKFQLAQDSYRKAMAAAKMVNAIERPSQRIPAGSWVNIRYSGGGHDRHYEGRN